MQFYRLDFAASSDSGRDVRRHLFVRIECDAGVLKQQIDLGFEPGQLGDTRLNAVETIAKPG